MAGSTDDRQRGWRRARAPDGVPSELQPVTDRRRPGRRRKLALVQTPPPLANAAWTVPAQPSPLVGRAAELAAARALLRDDVRLLTLVGPGGVGKTRLAVALAERLAQGFADGVAFVDLAPIRDPLQVVPAIARRFGASPSGGRSSKDALQDLLRHRQALLVLDNFEHLLEAAPRLAEILAACPRITAIATSRAPLDLRWEQVLQVPPLAVPDLKHLPPPVALARLPAVALFVDRARAVQRSFALTTANASAVAALCVRLDGLPLAIELAARQVAAYEPEAILARLGGIAEPERATGAQRAVRGPALGRGPGDLPVRQQTLEATIAWSYDLLSNDERALFRRLSVFEGGFTMEAGCSVAGFEGSADMVNGLVARSLVVREQPAGAEQPRYRLLETIRQFAADRLRDAGETVQLRDDHLAWCVRLAEAGYQRLRIGRAPGWRSRLEAEHENCRAALAWSEERPEHRSFARLVAALWWYWHLHGLVGETHRYLQPALAVETDLSPVRASLLNGAASFAYDRGEYGPAETYATEARALCQALGDKRGAALAQTSLGFIEYLRGRPDRAAVLLQEGLALARAADDAVTAARALNNLGSVTVARGDLAGARTLFEEALTLWRQLRSDGATALTLLFLGQVADQQGDHQRAETLLEESVTMARESRYARAAGPALAALARVARTRGEHGRAAALFRESLAIRREQGNRRGIAECLEGLAAMADTGRDPVGAARLLGAADALREAIGAPLPHAAGRAREELVTGLRRRLHWRYDDLHAEGAAMPLDSAVEEALDTRTPVKSARRRPCRDAGPIGSQDDDAPHPSPTFLSPREREVSTLVARGMSNRDIAAVLVETEGSAANYVQRILTKLGFRSRAQIAVWAARRSLTDEPDAEPR